MTTTETTQDFTSILTDEDKKEISPSEIDTKLTGVSLDDASASTMTEVKFQFRSRLDEQQLESLKRNAPIASRQMVGDYNAIVEFGKPVLDRMNQGSIQLLNQQRDIKIPEAEGIVNDLLREIDGYSKKFTKIDQFDGVIDKVKNLFGSARYSLKAMVRESKPISDKLDIAEAKLYQMEINLADNVTRGKELHKMTSENLVEVVSVLAALEEILEVTKAEFEKLDKAVTEASKNSDEAVIEYDGESLTVAELKERHTMYSHGYSEMEKTWFDWRQQFFLGYGQSPSILNLMLVSSTMRRRCMTFRTMGIPSARRSLALWQQAALAREGAEMGKSVQEGTNRLIQQSMAATGQAVTDVAMASQAPVITEETITAIIESVRVQCEGIIAADKWGRELRARNIKALEAGEKVIETSFTDSRRQLVFNALQGVQIEADNGGAANGGEIQSDVLSSMGIKK